jgi:HEAT repeat protein
VYLDPNKLNEADPAEILEEAARGHLGLDHRFLHSLLDRREQALPAMVKFGERDRSDDVVDLAPELIAIFRVWRTPEAIPFFIRYIREEPLDIPDELVEALVELRRPVLEPLLELYAELDETDSGEVAFVLGHLHIRDDRILKLLLERLEYDLSDTVMLLGSYGDPAAKSVMEASLAELSDESDAELKKEIAGMISDLDKPPFEVDEDHEFDIWELYPEEADLPVDLLGEETRVSLLEHPLASVRAAAAGSFFNRHLQHGERASLLKLAKDDESATVRARAWEALMTVTEETEVVEAMLAALRRPDLDPEERGGLTVALASEVDRNEVRQAISDLYQKQECRAKAMEAMWRSVHPSFRDYFAKHLNDDDLEVRRAAIWGVGYYGLRTELDRLRKFFDDEELRSDALFAYAMAIPAEISRGRVKSLLSRIEKDSKGLSEAEEELVKTALDERLMMAGKEPVFIEQED